MRPHVRIATPDGTEHELGHGDLVGRLFRAALRIDDGRISEAHAMVSLRGSELKLLALRGIFAVDGKRQTELVLMPGQVIHLAEDLAVEIRDVVLPDRVLALRGEGLPAQVLTGVTSLLVDPRPRLLSGYRSGAAARLWSSGPEWTVQLRGEAPEPFGIGDAFSVEGRRFEGVPTSLHDAGQAATLSAGKLHPPLRLVASFDTVQLHCAGREPMVLAGLPARLLSELVAFDGPVGWALLAEQLWSDAEDRIQLRRRLDITLARLRKKLRDNGFRSDLISADGAGNYELVLDADDQVEDRT